MKTFGHVARALSREDFGEHDRPFKAQTHEAFALCTSNGGRGEEEYKSRKSPVTYLE